MAAKKAIWISYDLGLRGDYSGLYAWLDSMKAVECGNGFAFFSKAVNGSISVFLKKEINEHVKLEKSDRIYIVYRETGTGKVKGKFLFGDRKRSPWEGYAPGRRRTVEDTAE